jgi:hypothetical protein
MLLITLLDDNEAKLPIVAYLRKPHICNNIYNVSWFYCLKKRAMLNSYRENFQRLAVSDAASAGRREMRVAW